MLQSTFGFGNNGSEEVVQDSWDPDSTRNSANGFGKKEWNLLVVNDKKVVNAMAAPGVFSDWTCDQVLISPRHGCRFHWYSPRCEG